MRFPKPSNLNGGKLAEELTAAGFPCTVFDIVDYGDEIEAPVPSEASDLISSHTGGLTEAEAEVKDQEDQLRVLRTKAKAVFNGTDTFTPAQVQKILAGLVLRATR